MTKAAEPSSFYTLYRFHPCRFCWWRKDSGTAGGGVPSSCLVLVQLWQPRLCRVCHMTAVSYMSMQPEGSSLTTQLCRPASVVQCLC